MIGETLGSYVLEQPLGAGGMGEVFLGVHRRLGRRVAVKLLLPEYCGSQNVLSRFFTEARATSSIDHPGIVQILDCDVHPSGRAYIVMEYLHGESLRAALGRVGPLTHDLPTAADVLAQAAEAVGAAHDKGIVHRDLKPDNIYLLATPERGRVPVKILDFGIAKLLMSDPDAMSRTRTGHLLGTPLYMSPEQCRSAATVDHRTDVYSLGCIGFELVCGRPPFQGQGVADLLIAHASQPPPTPRALGVELPGELEDLLMAMLAKNPDDRPGAMVEVAAALRAMAPHLPPAARPFQPHAPTLPGAFPRTELLPAPNLPMATPAPRTAAPAPRGLPSVVPTTFAHTTGTMDAPTLRTPPSRRGLLIGATVGVAALGVAAVAFTDLFSSSSSRRRRRATGSASSGSDEEGATATPVEVVPPPAARRSAPAAAEPETITIEVEGAPPGLEVMLDGSPAPLPLSLPRDGAVRRLSFRAPGYLPETRMIQASRSQTLELDLKKEARQERPARDRPAERRPKRPGRPAAPGGAEPIIDL
jgi:serine/threonine-protein kinase